MLTTLWIDITFFPLLILVPIIGIIGLITATAMVSHGILWSRFYFITLGLRLFCIASAGWAFWSYKEEVPTRLPTALERTASRRKAIEAGEPSKTQLMKTSLEESSHAYRRALHLCISRRQSLHFGLGHLIPHQLP